MRAIRYYGPGDLRLEDVPEPISGPGQIKVKVSPSPKARILASDLTFSLRRSRGERPLAVQWHVKRSTLIEKITVGTAVRHDIHLPIVHADRI